MKHCIIHVGMHKTGSTSIQNSLHGYSDEYFLYANLGNQANHSLDIFSISSVDPHKHHLHKAQRRSENDIKEYNRKVKVNLNKAIALANERTLVISGEDISALLESELRTMATYFEHHFDKISIVAYVRPPVGYITSAFQQGVKMGGPANFEISRMYRNYKRTFQKFDEVFGRDNVYLWKFDTKKFLDNCVVKDFCMRIGIELPPDQIRRLNESFSREAVSLIYIYRKFSHKFDFKPMPAREAIQLANAISLIGNTKFRISPALLKPVFHKHKDDIDWIEARMGESLLEDLNELPTDIRNEPDLMCIHPAVIDKLLEMLDGALPQTARGKGPQQIAQLVHALRLKLNSNLQD